MNIVVYDIALFYINIFIISKYKCMINDIYKHDRFIDYSPTISIHRVMNIGLTIVLWLSDIGCWRYCSSCSFVNPPISLKSSFAYHFFPAFLYFLTFLLSYFPTFLLSYFFLSPLPPLNISRWWY